MKGDADLKWQFRRIGVESERRRWLWAIKQQMDKSPESTQALGALLFSMAMDSCDEDAKVESGRGPSA